MNETGMMNINVMQTMNSTLNMEKFKQKANPVYDKITK